MGNRCIGSWESQGLIECCFLLQWKNFPPLRRRRTSFFEALSIIKRYFNPSRYEYTEGGSKNNPGGLQDVQINARNKVVPIHRNPSVGPRCHVRLIDLYISKIPTEAMQHDYFYLKPKKDFSPSDESWYTNQVLGKNQLMTMVPKMFTEAGLSKRATNHSLRATGTTELYHCGVPENVIKERTGHKSLDGVRAYERTSVEQQVAVSRILTDVNRSIFWVF